MMGPIKWRGPISTFASAFVCFMFLLPLLVCAEIFTYVDKEGVVHFTNTPTLPQSRELPLGALGLSFPSSKGKRQRGVQPAFKGIEPLCMVGGQGSYDPQIRAVCQRYGLADYNLVKAVIRAESAFQPAAVSPKGAQGLMQLMPGTARDMGVRDPFDPLQNLDGGVRYLKLLLDRFDNNYDLALAAYNAGPETVMKYGGVPPYDETQIYVQRVRDYYFSLGR